MASASPVKLEIGHVLFIDLVGYSKLLIDEQSDQMQKLREIVRGTEQFRRRVKPPIWRGTARPFCA